MVKADKPADPLLSELLMPDSNGMAALSQPTNKSNINNTSKNNLKNTGDAEEKLAAGVRRIRFLDHEISILNADKSSVYREMKLQGFDGRAIKSLVKALRIDPLVRAEIAKIDALYAAAFERAVSASEADKTDEAEGAAE